MDCRCGADVDVERLRPVWLVYTGQYGHIIYRGKLSCADLNAHWVCPHAHDGREAAQACAAEGLARLRGGEEEPWPMLTTS
jgi:hypothetical protein